MRRYRNNVAILLAIILTAILLSGCQVNKLSLGIGNFITGEVYPDAETYQTGTLTYDANQVNAVEVYWRSGQIQIVESDAPSLTVRESGGKLAEAAMLHYAFDGNTLRIYFCASGAKINVNPKDKHLILEIPKSIDLSIHTTSATIKASSLEQNNLLLAAFSGDMELGNVRAFNVDLSSSSGSISANSLSAQTLKSNTNSGTVQIEAVDAGTMDTETNSGSLSLGIVAASRIGIRTSSGDVSLRFPDCGAEVAYFTSSGTLRSDRSFDRKGDLYVFGNGSIPISVDSSSGNLHIR